MSTVGVSPDQQVPLYRKSYTSPELAATGGSTFTLNHGLGQVESWQVFAVCKVASSGMAVGEKLLLAQSGEITNTAAFGVEVRLSADGTQLLGRIAPSGIIINNTTITAANFRILVKAWAEPAPAVPWAAAMLGTNGYWKDQNTGLIIQWGYDNSASNFPYITFPIPFPNAALNVMALSESTSTYKGRFATIDKGTLSATGFRLRKVTDTGALHTQNCYWIVIGY